MKHIHWLMKAWIAGSICFAQSLTAKNITTFIPRSQGANTARELVGWQRQLYQNYCENYAVVAVAAEYTRSMNTAPIAKHLFNSTCLTFSGSTRDDRKPTDILADYFGLPTDFHGTLEIKPRIENYIIDIEWYFGLDAWIPGLFLRVHAPITHTKWNLELDSCVSCADKFRGCPTFPACYMSTNPLPTQNLTATPPDPAVCPNDFNISPLYQNNNGCATSSLKEALSGNFMFGDMRQPWQFGKFDFCGRDKTGLADIDAIIGFNFLHNQYAHFGAFVLTVIPTGNRPKGKYIFEPLVGNGKHWEAGGGVTGHIAFAPYDNKMCLNAAFYFEGNITHVFTTQQMRAFDFTNNGLLSRYMLLKSFDPVCDNGVFTGQYEYNGLQQMITPAGSTTAIANPAYASLYSTTGLLNAINFATRNCEVRVGLQTDVSCKLCLSKGGWTLDAGYNFFYRSKERVCIKTECPCYLDSRFLGFKGTEPVCCSSYQIIVDQTMPPPQSGFPIEILPYGSPYPAAAVPRLPDCPPLTTGTPSATPENPNPTAIPMSVPASGPSNGTQPDATIYAPGTLATGPMAPYINPSDCDVCLNIHPGGRTVTDATLISDLTPQNGFYANNNIQPEPFITCADLNPASAAQGKMMTHKVFGHLSYTFYQSCYNPHVGIGGEAEFDAHCDNALEQWGIWLKGGLEF